MNTPFTIALIILVLIILILFVIIRNRKDRKDFEKQLMQDHRETKGDEVDIEGTDSV